MARREFARGALLHLGQRGDSSGAARPLPQRTDFTCVKRGISFCQDGGGQRQKEYGDTRTREFPSKKVGYQIPFDGSPLPLSCPAGPAKPGGELRTGKITGNFTNFRPL